MIALYDETCRRCSEIVTKQYSTSFYSAIRLLHKDLRDPICGIYGFVRLADEIVDTFHAHDKAALLQKFANETWAAIADGISLNPVLHHFQQVVSAYRIPRHLIEAFLYSMQLDLEKKDYTTTDELNEYVYGSAEVVGLMCLCIFCEGNMAQYDQLQASARKLGAAFQKINFLRDLQSDMDQLQRSYFPDINAFSFDAAAKQRIEADIRQDFAAGLEGIRQLPWKARFGVYTAYRYYQALFRKISHMHPEKVLEQRIRVPDFQKALILLRAGMHSQFNRI